MVLNHNYAMTSRETFSNRPKDMAHLCLGPSGHLLSNIYHLISAHEIFQAVIISGFHFPEDKTIFQTIPIAICFFIGLPPQKHPRKMLILISKSPQIYANCLLPQMNYKQQTPFPSDACLTTAPEAESATSLAKACHAILVLQFLLSSPGCSLVADTVQFVQPNPANSTKTK